jgi:hypothetical protein
MGPNFQNRGPMVTVCKALTSGNGNPLRRKPPHTRNVAGAIPVGTASIRAAQGHFRSFYEGRAKSDVKRVKPGAHIRVGPGTLNVPDACGSPPPGVGARRARNVTADHFKAFTHDKALALWGDEMFADTVTSAR